MEEKVTGQEKRICTRCIYDSSTPAITFDENGVCNYCHMIDDLKKQYKTGTKEGEEELFRIIDSIKKEGKNKKYDCVVGVSGGTDSSFLLAKSVEWGLRPLAVHYDNTWNSAIATENIRKMTKGLNVDLFTLVLNNTEANDIFRAFFRANVIDLDCSTDIGFAETLYRAASQYGVKYMLEGHSFIAEGITPLGFSYFDGKYIQSVHKQFGEGKLKTFPNMTFYNFMKWTIVKKIKKIRPLWYINYSKKTAKEYLKKNFGWQDYGGHHLENRICAFSHSVYLPAKFGIDQRNASLSAVVRAGEMSREEALKIYSSPPYREPEIVEYFKKRTGINDEEYEKIMKGPKKTFRDYKTYKKRFERLRPLFYLLAKANLVPMSFYIKYTSKSER